MSDSVPTGLLVEPDGGLLVEPPTGSYRVLSSHVDGGLLVENIKYEKLSKYKSKYMHSAISKSQI